MSATVRNPTQIAECGCPYDPDYDAGHLGWHLTENHLWDELKSLQRDLKQAMDRLEKFMTAYALS